MAFEGLITAIEENNVRVTSEPMYITDYKITQVGGFYCLILLLGAREHDGHVCAYYKKATINTSLFTMAISHPTFWDRYNMIATYSDGIDGIISALDLRIDVIKLYKIIKQHPTPFFKTPYTKLGREIYGIHKLEYTIWRDDERQEKRTATIKSVRIIDGRFSVHIFINTVKTRYIPQHERIPINPTVITLLGASLQALYEAITNEILASA